MNQLLARIRSAVLIAAVILWQIVGANWAMSTLANQSFGLRCQGNSKIAGTIDGVCTMFKEGMERAFPNLTFTNEYKNADKFYVLELATMNVNTIAARILLDDEQIVGWEAMSLGGQKMDNAVLSAFVDRLIDKISAGRN